MFVIGIIGIFFGTVWLIWKVPQWQVAHAAIDDGKDRFEAENEARKTIAQVVGGLFFLLTLYFTWRSAEISRAQLDVARDIEFTDRFEKATSHLGSDQVAVRIGAIYALERIAYDSAKDHWRVMEILAAYIREKSPWLGSSKISEVSEKALDDDQTTDRNAAVRCCAAIRGLLSSQNASSQKELPLDVRAATSYPTYNGADWY